MHILRMNVQRFQIMTDIFTNGFQCKRNYILSSFQDNLNEIQSCGIHFHQKDTSELFHLLMCLTLYDNRGSVMINEQIERYSMIVLIFM